MKNLNCRAMQKLGGGMSCNKAWGFSFTLIVVGGLLAPFTFGSSLLLTAAGSGVATGNIVNNCPKL